MADIFKVITPCVTTNSCYKAYDQGKHKEAEYKCSLNNQQE